MPYVALDLEERAAAEVAVLRMCTRAIREQWGDTPADGVTIRDDGGRVMDMSCSMHLGSAYGARVANALAPLQLLAAAKVLDMLTEWMLEADGIAFGWQATAKVAAMRPIVGSIPLPVGLGRDQWARLFELFVALCPYRNAIAHAGWGLADDKGLHFDCEATHPEKKRVRLRDTITHDELSMLRDTVCSVYDISRAGPGLGVLGRQATEGLNALGRFHALSALPVTGPTRIAPYRREVKPDAQVLEDFDVDIARIRALMDSAGHITATLEVTYGDPVTPLMRYLIPWDRVSSESTIPLGPGDARWAAYRV